MRKNGKSQLDDDDDVMPDDGGHVGQWLMVDGQPVHILADPNMSAETEDLLAKMIRAVMAMSPEEIKAAGERSRKQLWGDDPQ